MDRKVVLPLLLSVLPMAVSAQQDGGLSRQVEVTKDYIPDVSLATKRMLVPHFGDTTSLRPDIEYSLSPVPMPQSGQMSLISPARVSVASYETGRPIWLKAGGGYPLNSEVDFYGVNRNSGSSWWGGFVNHDGLYPNLDNDYGQNVSSAVIRNKVGVFGRMALGKNDRLFIEGEGGYSYDYYARYAYMYEGKGSPKQAFSIPYLSFAFGKVSDDRSPWNFRVGASIYYLTDRFDVAERGIKPFVEVGRKDNLMLRIDMENYEARTDSARIGAVPNYKNTIIRLSPSYKYTGGGWNLKAGVRVVLDNLASGGFDTWVFPDVRVSYDLAGGKITPFIEATGDVYNNGVRNTMERSPYYDFVTTDFNTVHNTRRIDLRAGIGGDIGAFFTYKAYVGYSSYKRVQYMSYYDATSLRNPAAALSYGDADNLDVALIGGQITWRIAGRFDLDAGVHGYSYNSADYEHPLNMPTFDASLSVAYKFSDRISAWVGADVIGKRYFRYVEYSTADEGYIETVKYSSVSPMVDVGLGIDFKINDRWAVYAEGDNLAGSKLYLDPHYPSIGAKVTAGVKINF